VDVTLYGWLVNIDGEIATGPTGTIPLSTTFSGVKSNLEGAFAGFLDARWRRWHLLVDGSWVKIGDSVPPPPPFPGSSVDIDVESAFGLAGFAYELPLDLGFAWDVYLGARWWSLTNAIQLNPSTLGTSVGKAWGDIIVGTRLRYAITDSWRVVFLGDVGGGGARVDWQVFGGLGYDFNRHVGLTAGYRIMGVNFNRDAFVYDVTQQGLLLGLRVGF
jgi:hypothetical protein